MKMSGGVVGVDLIAFFNLISNLMISHQVQLNEMGVIINEFLLEKFKEGLVVGQENYNEILVTLMDQI